LQGIESLLTEMHNVEDVRDYIKEKISIRKILEIQEENFLIENED
jgi:hypothetical protein